MDDISSVDWQARRVAQDKLCEPNMVTVFTLVALSLAAVFIFGMLAFDSLLFLLR